MRAVLHPTLFASPASGALDLLTLFRHGLTGRHRIDADRGHPDVVAWLLRQDAQTREECELVLDDCAAREAREPARVIVHVEVRDRSQWIPPRLVLSDAVRLLDRQFVVLLEDSITDRAFLLCVASKEERKHLERLERREHLRFDQGGGLGSMKRRVVQDQRRDATTASHTTWLLFDSDALRPREPSQDSERLRAECLAASVPCHQLQRRSIESYLPLPALRTWADRGGAQAADARRAVRAFVRLTEDQRAHFNMKTGFEGDAKRRDVTAGDLYQGLADDARRHLAHGFGENIAELFKDREVVQEPDLRTDHTAWHELRSALRELIERTR